MVVALSTVDNPFNPITQFEKWFEYDTRKGYNSCAYLARLARTSPEVSAVENQVQIESAIDTIVKLDPLGIYIKVTENSAPRGGL